MGCSNCGKEDHNKRTCKVNAGSPQRLCGICREPGHDKRTCKGSSKKAVSSKGESAEFSPFEKEETFWKPVQKGKNGKSQDSLLPQSQKKADLSEGQRRSYSTNAKQKPIELNGDDVKNVIVDLLGPKAEHLLPDTANKDAEPDRKPDKNIEKLPISSSSKPSKKVTHWLNPKALERLTKGPTPHDEPGRIYIYQLAKPPPHLKSTYKIGCTKQLDKLRRIYQQEGKNGECYEVLFTQETPLMYVTDTVIKKQLEESNSPRRDVIDGGTEWYTGSKDHFIRVIKDVIREVKIMYPDD